MAKGSRAAAAAAAGGAAAMTSITIIVIYIYIYIYITFLHITTIIILVFLTLITNTILSIVIQLFIRLAVIVARPYFWAAKLREAEVLMLSSGVPGSPYRLYGLGSNCLRFGV